MQCPSCSHSESTITVCKVFRGVSLQRRRVCTRCGHAFTTYEVAAPRGAVDKLLPKSIASKRPADVAKRQSYVLKRPTLPASELARRLACSVDVVHKIRRDARAVGA